jgi:arylsulfatase A-like enzyme
MFHQIDKPNVIWVLVDQMRYQAMSHTGDPNVSTPHLDRFAIEGASFPYAISGTPLCSPFRGSLLTGLYPHKSSVPALNSPIDYTQPTIATLFQRQGYETAWFGKWHLDGDRPELDLSLPENQKNTRQIPPERRCGFDTWLAYENNNQPFNCLVHTDEGEKMKSFRLQGYETDALTDHAIQWIKDKNNASPKSPFFLVLSVQPPHNPYVAPDECMSHYNPARLLLRHNVPPVDRIKQRARVDISGYYGAIERIDWNFGRLRESLLEAGIDQNTFIIFFSDHGDMLGSHGQFRKQSPYEESIRIPFIVGGPTRKSISTKICNGLVNHVDIAPTTLGLCGIPQEKDMSGFNYAPFLFSDAEDITQLPESAYISLPVSTAMQPGLVKEESIDRPFRGIVTNDRWKYVVLEHQPLMLFDLNDDPLELVNLVYNVKYKDIRSKLHKSLNEWIKDTGDSFEMPILE